MHLVSTARYPHYTPPMRPGSYDRRRGAMGKVFYKDPCAWSRRYECDMPYWMAITSSGSHGIHATSPPYYHRLGSPASHGCVRQHRSDARILYRMVDIGTPVYVF
jgi:lipoprotein-anchoring transpeptidase ErfK/SrfK